MLQITQNYDITAFGGSKEFYGGSRSKMTGICQENAVSVNICRCSSWIILRDLEKENLGVYVK